MSENLLYHGTTNTNIKELEPKKLTSADPNHEARVYSSHVLALAAIFTLPKDRITNPGMSGIITNSEGQKYVHTVLLEEITNETEDEFRLALNSRGLSNGQIQEAITANRDFYMRAKNTPVAVYTLNQRDFKLSVHNQHEHFATEPVAHIPHLKRIYQSAFHALQNTGVKVISLPIADFLEFKDFKEKADPKEKISGFIKQGKVLNLSVYEANPEFSVFEN